MADASATGPSLTCGNCMFFRPPGSDDYKIQNLAHVCVIRRRPFITPPALRILKRGRRAFHRCVRLIGAANGNNLNNPG